MDTRLTPIEKPSSIPMKVVYFITKLIFGKVISPLKVVYSRLPLGFILFTNKISALDSKISLDHRLALMIKIHVAQINSCHFCIDIAKSFAISKFNNHEKFYNLQDFKTSSLYSPEEKAGLLFAEELTMNKKISDPAYLNAAKYFTERQLAELAWLVATEHYYNLINIAFNLHSDNLCTISVKKMGGKLKVQENNFGSHV